ncbi:hypothetical protein Bca4012_103285 [Brassica carinata]
MLTLEPFSEDQGRSTPWSVFQGGSNGSPQADALSTQMRGTPWRVLQTTIKAAASPRAPFHLYLAVLVRYRSRPYLALGGIYRPIGAAFPNNPTRRQRLRGATGSNAAGLSPSLAPLSRNLGPRVIRLTWGRVEDFGSSSFWTGATGDITRLEFTTACRGAPGALSSDFGQRVRRALGQKAWGATCVQRLRWFTGFCNSHQVSHFARSSSITSEISVASRFRLYIAALLPNKHRLGLAKANCLVACSLTLFVRGAESAKRPAHESGVSSFSGRSVSECDNDPSAGSPTETLFDFSFL